MLIQGKMGVRGVVHFFVFFFMLLVAALGSKDSEDHLLDNLINSPDINRDMVPHFFIVFFKCFFEENFELLN